MRKDQKQKLKYIIISFFLLFTIQVWYTIAKLDEGRKGTVPNNPGKERQVIKCQNQ